MNKKDLIKKVAGETGKSQKEVAEVVDKFLAAICDEVKEGNSVEIQNFGKFEKKVRPARPCVNLKTKEKMMSEEKEYVKFKEFSRFFFFSQVI